MGVTSQTANVAGNAWSQIFAQANDPMRFSRGLKPPTAQATVAGLPAYQRQTLTPAQMQEIGRRNADQFNKARSNSASAQLGGYMQQYGGMSPLGTGTSQGGGASGGNTMASGALGTLLNPSQILSSATGGQSSPWNAYFGGW